MCGIAGFFGRENPSACTQVRRMLRQQLHRGPDGIGLVAWHPLSMWQVRYAARWEDCTEPHDSAPQCVLGHNWLAIQDPSPEARQPMVSGDLALVFNGEIYNFIELREALTGQGAVFRTRSDTEVLLELWKREGLGCLDKLRGMFAFAVLDRKTQTLWAVRDPFGIKPFYYAHTSAGFYFASEIRALHAFGLIARELRPSAVAASAAAGINQFGERATLYEGIEELPAGHWLRLNADGFRTDKWYSLPDLTDDLTGDAATSELRIAADVSIQLHLRASRRIATCLSGGLDSTTVAWLIGKNVALAGHDFRTFTIRTAGPQDSELELAAMVSRQAGLRHQVVERDEIAPADVLEMIVAYEYPNHVIGPINQFLLLREVARSGATVVLDGQGGDELLSGYPWYVPVLLRHMQRRGQDITGLNERLRQHLPLDPDTAASFNRMFHDPAAWVRAFVWQGSFLGWSIEQLLELPETQYYLHGGGDWASFRQREYFRAELAYLLRQEDRLGMWFGLECRVPLVDRALVDVAARIAPEWLIHDGYLKYPFRVMLPDLPDAVRWNHRKRGFWETDRAKFAWVAPVGKQLVAESRVPRQVFPGVVEGWDGLNFDQQWRLLQLAVLERCASREDVRELSASLGFS